MWPCLRKSGPFSSKSLAIFSYNADLRSLIEITESETEKMSIKAQYRTIEEKRIELGNLGTYRRQRGNYCGTNRSSEAPFGRESRRARRRGARAEMRFSSDAWLMRHHVTATTINPNPYCKFWTVINCLEVVG